jgi:hypothetical protein
MTDDSDETVNAQLVTGGMARVAKEAPPMPSWVVWLTEMLS